MKISLHRRMRATIIHSSEKVTVVVIHRVFGRGKTAYRYIHRIKTTIKKKHTYTHTTRLIILFNILLLSWTVTLVVPQKVLLWHQQLIIVKLQETHQEIRYPNVTSLCFVTPLAFSALTEESPGAIFIKFCTEVKGWLKYKPYSMAKKYLRKCQSCE